MVTWLWSLSLHDSFQYGASTLNPVIWNLTTHYLVDKCRRTGGQLGGYRDIIEQLTDKVNPPNE